MSKTQLNPAAQSITDYLHLFVLVAFAIAQPVYDILGQNPEFFVAHQAKPMEIIGAVLLLSIGFSLVFVLVELIARIFGENFRRIVHTVMVFLLVALIVASPAKRWINDSDLLMIAFVLSISLIITVLYVRLSFMRVFISALSPVIIIFPLWFVWATPVVRLVMPQSQEAHADFQIENKVPVVLVVLDEFTTTALLDSQGQIDPVRFPNFAAFSAESWWYPNAVTASQSTVEAVPSILTGRNPRPEERLTPMVTDYPNNLFTMLDGVYSINASEAATSFIPNVYTLDQASMEAHRYAALFSDIVMIYLHLVVPHEVGRKLPSLDAGWTGFGQNIVPIKATDSPILHVDLTKKTEQLQQFLSNIKTSSLPELYFIHTLLPHIPYHYLASGQVYSRDLKLPDGIISDRDGWLGEEALILSAYNRYLQQVGYVDTFLGQLKKQLISAGIYDKSLVIVTADHGVAFQPRKSRRLISESNASEILKIPMFVKLPGQQEGRIDERIVSSVDVLPTIIDVLETKVPWEFDGYSMFSDEQPLRKRIEFIGFGHFNVDDIVGFSRLQWQVENFGERTPLSQLVPKGPYQELVGRYIDSIRIEEIVGVSIISNDLDNFQQVNLQSNFLPLLFKGYIEGSDDQKLPLVIAINGRAWATINTSEWDGQKNYFSVLLPKDAFVNGRNIVDVYLIDQPEDEPLLRLLKKGDRLDVKQSGAETLPRLGAHILTLVSGHEVPVEMNRNNMDGYLDWLDLKDGMLIFQGWAADLVENQPASSILIFKGEKLVWQSSPSLKREGVAKAFNQPSLLRSGYLVAVPLGVFEPLANGGASGDISVIAISKEKRAFRLYIKEEHKELLRTTLAK